MDRLPSDSLVTVVSRKLTDVRLISAVNLIVECCWFRWSTNNWVLSGLAGNTQKISSMYLIQSVGLVGKDAINFSSKSPMNMLA